MDLFNAQTVPPENHIRA